MKNVCFLCNDKYERVSDEACLIGNAREMLNGGLRFGVCPTCRRHAEIGRRVEGMAVAGLPQSEIEAARQDGWNKALAVAKGEKP